MIAPGEELRRVGGDAVDTLTLFEGVINVAKIRSPTGDKQKTRRASEVSIDTPTLSGHTINALEARSPTGLCVRYMRDSRRRASDTLLPLSGSL